MEMELRPLYVSGRRMPIFKVAICTVFSDFSWSDMVARLGHTDRFLIIKKPFDSVCRSFSARTPSGKMGVVTADPQPKYRA